MKAIFFGFFFFLISPQIFAAPVSLSCIAEESGMDLKYVTYLKNVSSTSVNSVEIGFISDSQYYAHCSSVDPIFVEEISEDVMSINGNVECVDGSKNNITLKLNLKTMELDNGVRVQTCELAKDAR